MKSSDKFVEKLDINDDDIGWGSNNPASRPTPHPRVPPTFVEYRTGRFLITGRPSDYSIQDYIDILHAFYIKDLVRFCESDYSASPLKNANIRVTDMVFEDGSWPPLEVVVQWLDFLKDTYNETPNATIAVHCVEGLGRSPLMVGIALLELGMKPREVVEFLRQKRRGVLNAKQATYLEEYQQRVRSKIKSNRRSSRLDWAEGLEELVPAHNRRCCESCFLRKCCVIV